MSELATTYVRIRPRSTGFKAEADTQLRRETPGDVSVSVTADTRPADDRLRVFGDKLDALRLKTATVSLDVNDRGAVSKLAAVDAAVARLDHARANPKIDLEGVAKAEAQIEALNLQLDRLDHRTAGGAGGGGLLGRLAGAGQGGFFGGMGLLGVAGGAAAVPLGIGALGLGASFLTPTVAGTAGLGLFGAASSGAFKRVGTVQQQLESLNQRIAATSQTRAAGNPAQVAAARLRVQAAEQALARAQTSNPTGIASARASLASAQTGLQRAQGGGANPAYDRLIKQRQQLLKQLTPAERDAAKGIDALSDRWKHFQRQLEPESFKLLATGTTIFRHGLNALLPMTKAVGDEVDHLATRTEKALDAPFWQHFFRDFLTNEAPRALDSLFVGVGHVVTGIAHLAEQWAPLGHQLEHDFVLITARFDQWSQGQGPLKFMAAVERDGPIAAKVLEALGHGLVGLAHGLEPIGRIELQALTPVLNFIGDLGQQHPAVIAALGVAYLGVAGGLKAIAAVNSVKKTLDGASIGMTGLRRSAALTAGVIGTVEIGRHSGSALQATLGGALTGLAAGLIAFGPEGAVIGAFAGGILSLGTYIASARGEVQSFTADVDALASSLSNAVSLDKGLLGKNVKQQVQQLLTTSPEFQKPGKYGHTLLETLAKYGVTIDDLIARAQGQYPADYAKMIDAAHKSGNIELINQATDLIFAIQQALRDNQALSVVGGSSGTSANFSAGAAENGGGGGKRGGGGGGKGGSAGLSLGQQGVQGGTDYATGVAAGITANISKAEQAVARLGQRVSAKLQSVQQKEASVAKSITDSLLGSVGLAALGQQTDSYGNPLGGGGSVTGIISGLQGQEVAIEKFHRELAREHKRGLSSRVEQQIAGLGLEQGGALADTLDSATRKQLRQITHLNQLVSSTARGVGHSLAHDIFGDQITGLRSALHEVNRTIRQATNRHKTLTESDYHHLARILTDALHNNPVVFDHAKHSRKQAREVWTS